MMSESFPGPKKICKTGSVHPRRYGYTTEVYRGATANILSNDNFQKPIRVSTPSSKLVRKPTKTQQKKQRNEVMTDVKNIIQTKTGDITKPVKLEQLSENKKV